MIVQIGEARHPVRQATLGIAHRAKSELDPRLLAIAAPHLELAVRGRLREQAVEHGFVAAEDQ